VLLVLSFGCGQAPSPPASPSNPPAQSGPSAEDVAALVKATQDAASKGGGAASATVGNSGTVQVGDHKLTFHADAPGKLVVSNNHGVVDIQGRHLDVDFENGRVALNEAEYAKLPDGAKDVAIEFRSGNLTVKADGKEVPKSDKSGAP
jgi:hypothetical protein